MRIHLPAIWSGMCWQWRLNSRAVCMLWYCQNVRSRFTVPARRLLRMACCSQVVCTIHNASEKR
jgi:hypothetical protein